MKINKTMGVLALGLGLAVSAQAQVDSGYTAIYLTGSTAFRAQIFAALGDLGLTAKQGTSGANSFTFEGTETANSSVTAWATTTAGGGGYFSQTGYNENGTKEEVFCDWSGSAEGCGTLLGAPGYTSTTFLESGGTVFNSSHVDFAFSDVAQASTPFSPAAGYASLTEDQNPSDAANAPFTGVAVVPFTFAVNKAGATAGITSISSAEFLALFMASPGYLDQSWFIPAVTPGSTPSVVAVGRYNLSGTRITAVLDDGGSLADPLYQWGAGVAASSGTNVAGYTVNGLHNGDSTSPSSSDTTWVSVVGDNFSTGVGAGGDGYFTGGNVGLALADNSPVSPAIGYIAWSDANGKFGSSGAVPILWNGEPSYVGTYGSGHWNITGLEDGVCQYWSYERLYENTSDLGTKEAPSFMDHWGQDLILALQYEITHASPQTADIEVNMDVYRNQDGGPVLPEITPLAPN